jgi:hypothetical protein
MPNAMMERMKSFALVILVGACSRDVSDTGPSSGEHPASSLSGTRPRHMENCPSAVATATTRARPTSDGVELTITAASDEARREIVSRAAHQAAMQEPRVKVPEHTGRHGGPGSIGFCPIIHANTIVTYEPTADGVRIHVAARSSDDVAALQRATDARVKAIRPTS